jgi:hypothetical protein
LDPFNVPFSLNTVTEFAITSTYSSVFRISCRELS